MPSKPPPAERRINVYIDDALHHRLRVLAADRRTTVSAIIRELVERELAKPPQRKKPR